MRGPMAQLMQQAQRMQENLKRAQEELATLEVIGQSGGGVVSVVMNGRHEGRRHQRSGGAYDGCSSRGRPPDAAVPIAAPAIPIAAAITCVIRGCMIRSAVRPMRTAGEGGRHRGERECPRDEAS